MLAIIRQCNVPRVLLQYMMINFLDFKSIKNVVLTVKGLQIFDHYHKTFLKRVTKSYEWNCEKGYLNVVKWKYERTKNKNPYSKSCSHCQIIEAACINGQLDLAKFAYSLKCYNKVYYYKYAYPSLFKNTCLNGYLDVLQWLHSINSFPANITEIINNQMILENVCKNGHLNVVQWLWSIFEIKPYHYDNGIFNAISNGHLDVVQWLYSNTYSNSSKIEIHHDKNIHDAIRVGQIEILQWLTKNNNISNQDLFKLACEYDNLNVAQQIYSLGDVNAQGILGKLKCPYTKRKYHPSSKLRKWLISLQQPNNLTT